MFFFNLLIINPLYFLTKTNLCQNFDSPGMHTPFSIYSAAPSDCDTGKSTVLDQYSFNNTSFFSFRTPKTELVPVNPEVSRHPDHIGGLRLAVSTYSGIETKFGLFLPKFQAAPHRPIKTIPAPPSAIVPEVLEQQVSQ